MIYMFTHGEYSSYTVYEHIEGPDEVDIEPYLVQAEKEAAALWDAWQARRDDAAPCNAAPYNSSDQQYERRRRWEADNPHPPDTLQRLLDILAPFGFKEVSVTEVHEYVVDRR